MKGCRPQLPAITIVFYLLFCHLLIITSPRGFTIVCNAPMIESKVCLKGTVRLKIEIGFPAVL